MESFEFYTASFEMTATSMTPVIGQQFDQDLIGSTGKTLHHFYASGQLWALLIGVVLGYAFKSMSSYG
ncbi:MAG: hypothetical protein DCF15_14595 [Phormidesmis priestleyi]|uniref:Uncharacterized protein n=1 Tax=Phormidesmis priestleyi TaxID=268141 RepID=A0A2W4Z006_9CYAN|nr:MAG: hypothetical protein DCF15_14595 [Phormidesmis priestleyi]